MPNPTPEQVETQIQNKEKQLRRAMRDSNIAALDELISPDLIFTNHLGQVMGKHDDIELHRSGRLKFHTLEPSDYKIIIKKYMAIVSVCMQSSGVFDNDSFNIKLRYTRVWQSSDNNTWQVVAGHSCVITNS